MKVGIFYNSISNPHKFPNKVALMDNFRDGVRRHGDEAVIFANKELPQGMLDLGFVLGYTLAENFRKRIINSLKEINAPQVFVDSNILHYARKEHEWHRYSLNSVYPSDGVYFFGELDRTKWDRFSTWHNASMKPWRESGDHILFLAQRAHGWNMFGHDQDRWLTKTIEKVRKMTGRPIVVRMHPGDRGRFEQSDKLRAAFGNDVTISNSDSICDDLANCWCTVGYNSTPNVVAAIEGVPCYVHDPKHSWAADISFNDLLLANLPPTPDRSEWIHKIANIHWSNDEVRNGDLWDAIKYYISSSH